MVLEKMAIIEQKCQTVRDMKLKIYFTLSGNAQDIFRATRSEHFQTTSIFHT